MSHSQKDLVKSTHFESLLESGLELLEDDAGLLLAGYICVSTLKKHTTSFDQIRHPGEFDLEESQWESEHELTHSYLVVLLLAKCAVLQIWTGRHQLFLVLFFLLFANLKIGWLDYSGMRKARTETQSKSREARNASRSDRSSVS
jgi:hypothetical protein